MLARKPALPIRGGAARCRALAPVGSVFQMTIGQSGSRSVPRCRTALRHAECCAILEIRRRGARIDIPMSGASRLTSTMPGRRLRAGTRWDRCEIARACAANNQQPTRIKPAGSMLRENHRQVVLAREAAIDNGQGARKHCAGAVAVRAEASLSPARERGNCRGDLPAKRAERLILPKT